MNLTRIVLASLGAFAAYFVAGGLWAAVPAARTEFGKYPNVYRPAEGMKSVMPWGMAAMFLAIVALAFLYALVYRGGSGLAEGARFGALIGVFAIGSFVVHNYVNLNIGVKITVIQAISYLILWVVVGIALGLIYKPLP